MVENFLGCRKRNAAGDLVVKGSSITGSRNAKGPALNMMSVNIINAAELLQIIVENSFWNLFRVC